MRAALRLSPLLLLLACPKAPPVAEPPPPTAPHHGAWYGSGPGFPDGRLCLVFCPDGRMFAGDAACAELTHPKLSVAWQATVSADVVEATQGDRAASFRFRIGPPERAAADIGAQVNLPFDRVADRHPLCLPPGTVLPGSAPRPAAPSF
jgi:hypothetical protein